MDAGKVGLRMTQLQARWEVDVNKSLVDKLLELGPRYGYYPNASKTYLLVKPAFYNTVKTIFQGTEVNITSSGQRYLGAALGTDSFKEEYVKSKVSSWVGELQNLCEIAKFEPQVAYSAFVFGLSKEWHGCMS